MYRIRRYFLKGKDKNLSAYIRNVFGVTPRNLNLYYQAFRHCSVSEKVGVNNERLEFLGDSILNSIAAEYLFNKFSGRDEGFLTEMRSRIVNRSTLNQLSVKLGIPDFVEVANDPGLRRGAIYGNTFEALIGALYLDTSYDSVKEIIIQRVFKFYLDLDKIETTDNNFKSKLLEWAQAEKKIIEYQIREEIIENNTVVFYCTCHIDGLPLGSGSGTSKKRSEQMAAQATIDKLGI